jgi:DNA-binding GntR family transcriptional regulator
MKPINMDRTKPVIEPIKRVKLYEEVAARIRDLIAEGELRPGQALPSERKLADQFKVGRAVIREAIRQLEVSGLVESRHGGGNYVREITVEHLVAPIASVLNGMSHLREELMDARLFFEPQIAQAAAAHATPEDLQLLKDVIRRQEERTANGQSGAQEDAEFHDLLARGRRTTRSSSGSWRSSTTCSRTRARGISDPSSGRRCPSRATAASWKPSRTTIGRRRRRRWSTISKTSPATCRRSPTD